MTHIQRNRYYAAPRRLIKKVCNRLDFASTNGAAEIILHQIERSETLVRTIIQLEVYTAVGGNEVTLALLHEPRGITVITISEAQELDQAMSKVELWYHRCGQGDVYQVTQIMVDLKSMRKVEEGDQIVLRHIDSGANAHRIVGVVTLFFKQ